MRRLVPSSPHFFRPVERALLAGVAALCLLAALLPAPLDGPARPDAPPNPVKSAWFLLWIQELVSHDTRLVYVAVGLACLLVALPWLARRDSQHAEWLHPAHRWVAALVLVGVLAVGALTLVAAYFRGANWCLALP